MAVHKQSMMKNTALFLLSIACQKAMTLVYFVIVANTFGPAEQGRYSTALAFTALFGVFVDVGTSAMLTREAARKGADVANLIRNMFCSRIVLGIGMYGVIVACAYVIGYPDELIKLIVIAAVAAIIDTCSVVSWAIVRGFHNLTYEAIGGVLAIGIMVAIGGTAMFFHLPVVFLVYAVAAGSASNFALALWVLARKLHFSITPMFHRKTMKTLFTLSLPFAGAAIFSRIYTFADIPLLARLSGEHAAGLYSAAVKIVLALNLIPSSLSASLYPTLSTHAIHRPEQISGTFAKTVFVLALIAFPVATGIGILAPAIVGAFYNESYTSTIPLLQLLSVSIVFGFLYFPVGALLAATNQQVKNTIVYGMAALLSIIGNSILVIAYGAYGAALTAVLVSVAIFTVSFIAAFPHWKSEWRYLFFSLLKICISTVIMAVFILIFAPASLVVRVSTGVVVYAICVIALRLISLQDARRFSNALRIRSEPTDV